MRRDTKRGRKTAATADEAARPPSRGPGPAASVDTFPGAARDHPGGKGSRGANAYQLLKEAIGTGRLPPGARVLESELATLLGMSRTPIREAIAALEADGLVSIDGARGRVVTKLDYQAVMELYAVREILESTAAALAARNASDMEIVALRGMLELEEQIIDDAERLVGHNRRFHEAIYYCSHNRYIVKMLQHIQSGMHFFGPITRTGKLRRETFLMGHVAIVDAIEAHDPAAAEAAMRSHVRGAQQARIKLLLQSG